MKYQPILSGLLLTAAMLAVASPGSAETAGVDRQERAVTQTRQMFTPLAGQNTRIMMETELDVLASPETADKLAAYARNYFMALIKQGFTDEQALELVKSAGFPLVPMPGQ